MGLMEALTLLGQRMVDNVAAQGVESFITDCAEEGEQKAALTLNVGAPEFRPESSKVQDAGSGTDPDSPTGRMQKVEVLLLSKRCTAC